MDLQNSVLDDIKTKQFIWYRQVQRMIDNRWPKEILAQMPPGGRVKRTRLRVTWSKGIKDAIAKRVVEEGQWMNREAS
jgi:hypothetical protein